MWPPPFPRGNDALRRGDRRVKLHEAVHLLLQETSALTRQGRHEDNDRTSAGDPHRFDRHLKRSI